MGVSWESEHLLASLLPGISSPGCPFLTSILSAPPPASFGLSADSRSVSSCKQLNIIFGFPASFPAPHSFPGGEGGWWCCGAPLLTREAQHFKARDGSQGGPPTRGRRLPLWVLKCSNTPKASVHSCTTVLLPSSRKCLGPGLMPEAV